MADPNTPTRAVLAVLDELRTVVQDDAGRSNGVVMLGFEPEVDLRPIWGRLVAAFEQSLDVVKTPRPGQGLATLWLKAVKQRADHVEDVADKLEGGVNELLWCGSDPLHWLVEIGWQSGHQVLSFNRRWNRGIRSLDVDEVRPLRRLRQLAEQTADNRDEKVGGREVGELMLQAVNNLDVDESWLKDVDFREHIIGNIDFPPAIAVPPLVDALTPESIQALVARLEAGKSDVAATPETVQPTAPTIDIEEWASITEPFDRDNNRWVSNRRAASLENKDTESLARYRRSGKSTPDKNFGRDIHGRIWRRVPNSHPWYLRHTLLRQ